MRDSITRTTMTVMMISTTREGTHGGDLEHRFHPASPHEKPIRYNSRTATTDDHARWPLSSDAAGHRPGWPVRHPQGFDVIDEQQPSFLFERSVLVTGEVRRTTGYEPGLPPQQGWLHNSWQPDPLVLDDQALILNVRGKGLVVLTGCGHAGVINIARYARRLTGDQPLHALLGGFHLSGPVFEPITTRVLDHLAALHPRVLVPAHCTGWRAQHAMSARFGPTFIPNCVGTTFHL